MLLAGPGTRRNLCSKKLFSFQNFQNLDSKFRESGFFDVYKWKEFQKQILDIFLFNLKKEEIIQTV